jgi:hypothetical protein
MTTTKANTFKGFTINTGNGRFACDEQILEQLHQRIQFMLSHNSRVLEKRLDLHYPQDGLVEPASKHIYRFTENLHRDLKRNNPLPEEGKKRSPGRKGVAASHPVNPQILWVKEQEKETPNPHYHLVVLVNGNAVKSGWSIQKRAERQWANTLNLDEASGLVHNCNQSGPDAIAIDQNRPDCEDKTNQVYYHGSYLAKTRSKEHRAKYEWKSGGTRVPKE